MGLTLLAVVAEPQTLPELEKLTTLTPFPTLIFPTAQRGGAITWLSAFQR